MKRMMMQVYVKGSNEAVKFYQKAFHAEMISGYSNPDGTYYHSELAFYGQTLAVSEAGHGYSKDCNAGIAENIMQFCLQFEPEEEQTVREIYSVLKEGAELLWPLGACDYSPLMADLIDRYGVRWCIFYDTDA